MPAFSQSHLRTILGYRCFPISRLYGAVKNWRTKDAIPPLASIVVAKATDGTALKITYTLTATSQVGGSMSYLVDFGDSSTSSSAIGTHTYSAPGTYTVTGTATDSHYGIQAVTASITPDQAPTDIALSAASFVHTALAAATIGTLSTTDPDTGNTFTYTLVAGAGSTDNASFAIVGNLLKVGGSPVSAGSYTVRVRTTDQNNVVFEKAFALTST